MHKRFRIPPQLVEQHKEDLCFEVDTNTFIVRAMEPRTMWLPPMGYEMDIDAASIKIKGLLEKPIDIRATQYGNYEEVKNKIKLGILVPKSLRKNSRMISSLLENLGILVEAKEVETSKVKGK